MTDTLSIAKHVTTHIRRCCTALVDGTVKASKHNPAFWVAKIISHANYWRYPIITPTVRKNCAALGVTLNNRIEQLSGVPQLCAFLKAIEEPVTQVLSRTAANSSTITVLKELNPDAYTESRISKLPLIFAPVQAGELPGVTLFLHGSMADLRHTSFSDVDDLVILRRTAWQDPVSLINTATRLARLARAYQNIDPLQHHGHWVLTEFDLMHLDPSYLPLIVLENAVRVVGDAEIQARVQESTKGFKHNAVNTLRSMERTLSNAQKQGGVNAYFLKGLVGEIALMPAYLFQAQGEMMNKPEAIAQASDLFSQESLPALGWATRVRDEFSMFIEHPRTRLLQRIASLICARRYQAEWLFRRYAPWVSNQHNLGLKSNIISSIQSYIQESHICLEKVKP